MSFSAEPIAPEDVTVAILAGGKSRRFGSDKALAVIPSTGLTFLQHAIEVARRIAHEVVVVGGDATRYADSGARVVPDSAPDCGPVGGLSTALNLVTTKYLVVTGVDQPMLTAADLRRLLDGLGAGAAAVFAGPEGRFEPLPVALVVSRCRAVVQNLARTGSLPLRDAICGLEPTIYDPGDVTRRMLDADTRDDLARIVRIMATNRCD